MSTRGGDMSRTLRVVGWLTVVAATALATFAAARDAWLVFAVAVLCAVAVATTLTRSPTHEGGEEQ